MAAIRKGASKLGVEIHWSYAFVPRGTAADTTADAIYLDTGGRLAPGVIDQHSSETPGPGTADLVLRHPELAYSHLLGPWLQRARDCHELERREWDLVIVTHEDPNFDAVVSAFLVQCLVEDGEFPPGAEGLVAYACEVELGRYKVDMNDVSTATQAIHMAYLAIQHLTGPDGETYKGDQLWAWRLQRGIELVRLCLRKLYEGGSPPPSRAQDLHPCSEAATAWAQEDAFKDASELLERDQEAYRSDLRNKTEEGAETQVTLPAADGSGTIQVRGVILLKPPDSKLNRYWARAEGCPFFVCPYHLEGHDPQDHGEEDWYPHVYISIDPTWEEVDAPHRRPTLEGLAAVLDDAEAKLGGGAHAHRSWYDGSDYGHTIVWAPHDGTRLPYSRVRKLVESSFWTMPVQQYDLTLMYVGVDDAVTEGRPTPPRHPDDLSLVMKRYLRDSATYMASPRTRDLTTSRQFEPPEVSVRRLPFGTCPPVTMLRLDHRKVPLRLDDLAAYCRKIHEGEFKSSPLYVYARLCIDPARGSTRRTEQLLQEICGGAIEELPGAGEPGEVVRYNGHAVVVTSTAGWRGSSSVHELNQELLLYAAFLNETINHLSGNITTALIGTDRPPYDGRFEADGLRKASMLREGFLAFHAKYYHFDVTHRAASRQLFDRVIERSEFRVRYGELENELDRLHQIEQGRTERLMQHILFALGLAGIVEMTAGIASLELMGIRWVAIFTFVLLMSAIGTYGWVLTRGGFHRGRRRLPPGERETARRHLTWPTKPAEITEQPPADAAGSARTEPPVESSDELVPGT